MDARFLGAASSEIALQHYVHELNEQGYCIVTHAAPVDLVHSLDWDLDARFRATPFCEGTFYGPTTKRFGSLLKHSDKTDSLVRHKFILAMVQRVLGRYCDRVQLNLTQAVEIHPGAAEQLPHRDQDMWGGPKGSMEYLVNVIWPLSHFKKENGATVVWPKSHIAQEKPFLPRSESVAAEMEPGSALVFLGSTLHAGGANQTKLPRRGVIVSYCLGWLRQFEAQLLIYPPEVAKRFSPELAALIGYDIHRPNLGNYEGQNPSVLLNDEVPNYIQAKDALRPEQEAFIANLSKHPEKTAADRFVKLLEATD